MLSPVKSQMSTRKAKCVLVFTDKSDSTRPGPLVFIPHVVASRSLPRLLRALPAQPSRETARWGWVAARDQTRRLPNAGAPRRGGVAAVHPQRARLDRPLSTDRARCALPQSYLVPDRWRGGRL